MTVVKGQSLCERAPKESAKYVTARMICDHKGAHRAENGGLASFIADAPGARESCGVRFVLLVLFCLCCAGRQKVSVKWFLI